MIRINPGDFDTVVTVQSVSTTRGAQGQRIVSYAYHSDCFAKVDRNVNESVSDNNLEASQAISLTMYKIEGLTTRWRVLVADKPYEIRSIDPLDRISPYCILTLQAIDG